MKITELLSPTQVQGLSNQTTKPGSLGTESFEKVLIESVNKVNGLQLEADQQIEALSKGEQKDIHKTMISMEKAAISFELMMQVRNKIISAYDEIRRMPI